MCSTRPGGAGRLSGQCGLSRDAEFALARDQAEFALQWDNPVEVAEIVYYGRTGSMVLEGWKDYEVYLDEAP